MYQCSATSIVRPAGATELTTTQLDAISGGDTPQQTAGKILVLDAEIVGLTVVKAVLQTAVNVLSAF